MRTVHALVFTALLVLAACTGTVDDTSTPEVPQESTAPQEIEPSTPLTTSGDRPPETVLSLLADECSSRDDDVFQGCSFTACKVRPGPAVAGYPSVYCPVVLDGNRLLRIIETEVPGGVERTTVVVGTVPSGETAIAYPGADGFATVYYVYRNGSFVPVLSEEALESIE